MKAEIVIEILEGFLIMGAGLFLSIAVILICFKKWREKKF